MALISYVPDVLLGRAYVAISYVASILSWELNEVTHIIPKKVAHRDYGTNTIYLAT